MKLARPEASSLLAILAILLGILAPLLGSGAPPGDPGVAELARELAAGDPFLDPVHLGEWIRDGRSITLVDLRAPESFRELSVPTASNLSFQGLRELPEGDSIPLVLMDGGDGTAVRAWLFLRRLGRSDVLVLDGGILGWVQNVLNPVLPNETSEERSRFREVSSVSRFFGGLPRVGDPLPESGDSAEDAIHLLTRRGCH